MNLMQDEKILMTVKQAVEYVVDDSQSYTDGQLEGMVRKIATLNKFVGAILDQLPASMVVNIMNEVSYGWTGSPE